MPASMAYPASLCEPQDAASVRKLERGSRGHPREGPNTSGLREPGMDARLQRAAGRGVDAQVERGHRAIRVQAGACSDSREPGRDARLQQAAGRGVDART